MKAPANIGIRQTPYTSYQGSFWYILDTILIFSLHFNSDSLLFIARQMRYPPSVNLSNLSNYFLKIPGTRANDKYVTEPIALRCYYINCCSVTFANSVFEAFVTCFNFSNPFIDKPMRYLIFPYLWQTSRWGATGSIPSRDLPFM